MRIFLIGYMGSGKSKTAETLAKIFNSIHLDTDEMIEMKTGSTISSIFEKEGQELFREMEKEALHSTLSNENCIVSTGGGTPCFFDNMEWMNRNGITIYLEANAGLLYHRLATSKAGRPLIEKLNDVDLIEQITGHLVVRIPFYKQAMITVSAANMNPKSLAEKINSFMKK